MEITFKDIEFKETINLVTIKPKSFELNTEIYCNSLDYKLPIGDYVYLVSEHIMFIPKGVEVNGKSKIINLINLTDFINIEDFDVYHYTKKDNSFKLKRVKVILSRKINDKFKSIIYENVYDVKVKSLNRDYDIAFCEGYNNVELEVGKNKTIFFLHNSHCLLPKNLPYYLEVYDFCEVYLGLTILNIKNIDDFEMCNYEFKFFKDKLYILTW